MPEKTSQRSTWPPFRPQLILFSVLAAKIYEHELSHGSANAHALVYYHAMLTFALAVAVLFWINRSMPIFLLNFTCYKAPDSYRMPISNFAEHAYLDKRLTAESSSFLVKIMENSGFSDETSISLPQGVIPIENKWAGAMEECQTVVFSVVANLLRKCRIKPKNIDILVTHSSMFSPVPSITAMIVNKFEMRSNVMSYNLSGMGCSAGIIAVDLAKDLLRVHRNSLALVVTTEVLHMNWYTGTNRSMLLANCLFRMGGTAMLLSSRDRDKRMAKYELQHIVRTTKAQSNKSYGCVFQDTDMENKKGVSISKNILNIAGDALKTNIATLGPKVLPLDEQFYYLVSLICRKVKLLRSRGIYMPSFRAAFEHFCIHTGGRSVIKAMKTELKLNDEDIEASKMALYRFGNTSSSSIWYELSYVEAKGRMKSGDRIWQIAFGSGFKCNSAVWKCLQNLSSLEEDNPWMKIIDSYPVDIPD
uniref:3-ketoacyl-CoA synthase n=1 Tax=Kalanchoe fedtschenkoi TaxID=63787 RepID=A0A7N0UIM3_KALFE